MTEALTSSDSLFAQLGILKVNGIYHIPNELKGGNLWGQPVLWQCTHNSLA